MIQERSKSFVFSNKVTTIQSQRQQAHQRRFASITFQSLRESLAQISAAQSNQDFGSKILEALTCTFQAEVGLFCSWDASNHITIIHNCTNMQQAFQPLLSFQSLNPDCFPQSYCRQYHFDIVTYPFLYKLKQTSNSAYQYWKTKGYRSILFIPIWQSQDIKGWIILGSLSYFQKWSTIPSDILTRVQMLSAKLLERLELQNSIREYQNQAHLEIACDSGEATYSTSSEEMRWVATQEMKPVFFNQAWLKFIGLSLTEAIEKDWSTLVHPEDTDRFQHSVQQAILTQSSYSVAYRILRVDGQYRWILQSAHPREIEGYRSYFYHGTCLDITDQFHSRADVTYYDSYLELISFSTEDGLFIYDFDRRSTYLSSQFISMLNCRKSAALNFLGVFKPYLNNGSLDHLTQTIQQHLENKTPFCVEYPFSLKDGQSKQFQIRGSFHFRTDGQPYQLIGSLRDAQTLSSPYRPPHGQTNLAQTTLMSIGEPLITTDIQGNITSFNAHAEVLTGHLREEVQGHPVHEVLHLINEYTGSAMILALEKDAKSSSRKMINEDIVLISKDQSHFNVQISIAPILSESHRHFGMIITLHDVTQSKQVSKQLAWEAQHDPLTGLYNRREFENQLQHELRRIQDGAAHHILFFMDLDRFKLVNDSAGHLAGDHLLKQVAQLLKKNIQTSDLVARIGGDEFCILLRNCTMPDAEKHAQTIREQIRQFRFCWNNTVYRIGISMGLVQLDADSQSLNEVLKAADLACQMAKENGRDRIQVYQENDFKLVAQKDHRGWGVRIQQALEENEFILLFQNIFPMTHTHHASHAEILLRINDPHRGLVTPGAFLSAAERYDLMPKIDSWVIQNSLKLIQQIQARSTNKDKYPYQWMINLSGASLNNDDFIDFLVHQLAQFPGQTENIGFEITETVAIANLEQTRRLINACKKQGCQFALDDFGCGVSSFEYLKSLPVDFIKIDGQFISSMLDELHVKAMVEAINHVGHVMNIKTVAEWVETKEQFELLKTIGVDYIQGYGFHRPQQFKL